MLYFHYLFSRYLYPHLEPVVSVGPIRVAQSIPRCGCKVLGGGPVMLARIFPAPLHGLLAWLKLISQSCPFFLPSAHQALGSLFTRTELSSVWRRATVLESW